MYRAKFIGTRPLRIVTDTWMKCSYPTGVVQRRVYISTEQSVIHGLYVLFVDIGERVKGLVSGEEKCEDTKERNNYPPRQ